MTATVRFNADQLIEVPAQHIAITEILKGTFDDKIAEIKALRDELKARQDVDQTLEKANAALADAHAKQQDATKALADAKFNAEQNTTNAANVVKMANAMKQQAESDAAKVAAERLTFEAEKENAIELMNQRHAALDLREFQLAKAAAKIGEDQRALALERDAFNRKLELLKA